MGSCCCKDEDDKKERKQSELPDNWNPNRVDIIGRKTKVKVMNNKLESLKVDGNVLVVSSKGLSPLLQPQQIEVLQKCLSDNDGYLRYGECYPLDLQQTKLFLVVIPIWKGNQFNEISIMKSAFTKMVQLIKKSNIQQLGIDDVGVKYFGYPRQLIISSLIEAFKIFMFEDTYLEQIIYASPDKLTVFQIETQLKAALPELFQEPEQPSVRKSAAEAQNDVTSDLEKPLLAE